MANQGRKSVEPIALRFTENPQGGMPAEKEVVALQGFLRDSPWEAGDDTPWEHLALVTGVRIRVEEYFEDAKMHLGMAACESRAWSSWHHHMALVECDGCLMIFVLIVQL